MFVCVRPNVNLVLVLLEPVREALLQGGFLGRLRRCEDGGGGFQLSLLGSKFM